MVESNASDATPVRPPDRGGLDDATTVGQTDQVCALDLQRVEHPEQVVGGVGHGERGRRAGGPTVTAHVVRVHPAAVGELVQDRLPHPPVQAERVHQDDGRSTVAALGDHRLVVAQLYATQFGRSRYAGLGQHLVDDPQRVERTGKSGVDRHVFAQRAELRSHDAVVQRGPCVYGELRLGSAQRGQHRDGREFASGPVELGLGQGAAKRSLDHRVVQLG